MDFPITFELGPKGGTLRFRKVEEFRGFLDSEQAAWGWLPTFLQYGNQQNKLNDLQGAFNRLANDMNNARANLDAGNLDQAFGFLTNYFQNASALPYSESPHGEFIRGLQPAFPAAVAAGALATVMSIKMDGDDPAQVRGVVMANEYLAGTGTVARKAVQDGLTSLLARLAKQQLRAEDRADSLDRRVEEIEAKRRSRFERLLHAGRKGRKAYADDLTEARDLFNRAAEEAILSIKNTEQTYTEHMALKGPVTYWRDKAKEHRTKARLAGGIGLGFAALLIAYAYVDGTNRVLDLVKSTIKETHLWQVGYVVLTIVVFVLTIVFWIGRLISRTYVSQTHLALDAEERATMVQTYLALANENKISEAERILVLGALFRGSADGLVKDDGVPDLSIVSALSRVGVGGPAK